MPATDILNPRKGFDPDLGNSMNPNYGFTQSRTSTLAWSKPPMGYGISRETSNAGHTFKLSWLRRPPAVVRRLKRFFEQYEDGVFTIIDWDYGNDVATDDEDGKERHFVGRFVGEFPRIPQNFRTADVTLTFEEVPGSPMVKYPDDWDNDAIELLVLNDAGDQRVNTSGTWAQTAHAADVPFTTLDNDGTNVAAFAQIQYRGYGFRLKTLRGPGMGIWQVWLDGVELGTVDLHAAADAGAAIVFEYGSVPLDIHRVKLVATNTSSGADKALNLFGFEVMR